MKYMHGVWEGDWEPSNEELETAGEIYDNLRNSTFYQREVDAMRAMGGHNSAEKLKHSLNKQGIDVV